MLGFVLLAVNIHVPIADYWYAHKETNMEIALRTISVGLFPFQGVNIAFRCIEKGGLTSYG